VRSAALGADAAQGVVGDRHHRDRGRAHSVGHRPASRPHRRNRACPAAGCRPLRAGRRRQDAARLDRCRGPAGEADQRLRPRLRAGPHPGRRRRRR
jgi:hypothetical protein